MVSHGLFSEDIEEILDSDIYRENFSWNDNLFYHWYNTQSMLCVLTYDGDNLVSKIEKKEIKKENSDYSHDSDLCIDGFSACNN